jgi:hypothetical protein
LSDLGEFNVSVALDGETFVQDTNSGLWTKLSDLGNYGLPTMFKKALAYVTPSDN